jgi:hypothetical protein
VRIIKLYENELGSAAAGEGISIINYTSYRNLA